MGPRAVVVDGEAGRALATVSPDNTKVEFLEQTWGSSCDDVSDLAKLPSVRLPMHVDGAANETLVAPVDQDVDTRSV